MLVLAHPQITRIYILKLSIVYVLKTSTAYNFLQLVFYPLVK